MWMESRDESLALELNVWALPLTRWVTLEITSTLNLQNRDNTGLLRITEDQNDLNVKFKK